MDQGGTSASPVGPGLRMLAGEELRRQGPADSSRLWSPNDAPSGTAEAAAGAAAIAGQLATALGQLSVALCSTAQAAEQRAEGSGNGASRVPVTPPPGQRSDPPRSCSAA